MTIIAIYDVKTGNIQETRSTLPTDPGQLANWQSDLQAKGRNYISAPDGTDGSNSWVDIGTQTIQIITPTPAIPNIMVQYIAAQINAGTVSPAAFHPATLADVNVQLAAANLTPAKIS